MKDNGSVVVELHLLAHLLMDAEVGGDMMVVAMLSNHLE